MISHTMRGHRRNARDNRAVSAFSLIEMLVVIAIIAALSLLMIPAVGPMLSNNNLSAASMMVSGELTFARQTALAVNADVEVRFYEMPTQLGGALHFRAFRCFIANATTPAKAIPLDMINYLPGQVIISENSDPSNSPTTYSPLLDNSTYPILTTGTDLLPNGTMAKYVSFLYRASGGTNLRPVTSLWYLTLCNPIPATGLPANYATIQIDPVIGTLRTYRP